jgi:2-iminobutanoate/2-iminopropanoate deaminase
MKEIIYTDKAPKPMGAYSQAVVGAGLVFVSGQLAIDPRTNEMVKGGIRVQTKQALENLTNILASQGIGLKDVVKVTVFLRQMSDFEEMNSVYKEFFGEEPPARSCVAVAEFPPGFAIEVDCMALSRNG